MLGILSKLLGGNKSEKDIKTIQPIVKQINQCYEQYQALSNDELRGKTAEFKARIKDYLKEIDNNIQSRKSEAEKLPSNDMAGRDAIYQEVDELSKERDKKIEEILDQILPEAFGVMKETARRFMENDQVVSIATDLDRELAVKKNYIIVDGETATYNTAWEAAGMKVAWKMLHYDVQLIGGIVLHQGKIAEMATGEGKTLVSTLPAYLNALAGEGVHIVTVNDYLARRDSEWNGPLYEWLGLKVDCIDKHQPNSPARRNAYLADITYGTNNEFGFDYLRDNMVHSPDEMVQRKHHYAMVDEVDSVLIDDARTPLIISGPVGKDTSTQLFFELKDRVASLVAKQKQLTNNFLVEAKKKIAEGNDDAKDGGGGLALFRAHRGLPKTSSLIKFLSEPGMRQVLQKVENYHLADQQREMPKADAELLFYIDEKNNQVDLTDKGIKEITGLNEDPNFFMLPDIATKLSDVDKDGNLSPEEKMERKESLFNEYSAKTERIHAIQQLLKAYTLFEKDDEYVVIDGQVKIVDEQTGRIMEGRRYSDGLHQALEAKENVKIEASTQTYATVTLQNYFRMYHKLCGMTGTAETEAAEFWEIYKLDVVTIPTNVPVQRQDQHDLVYKTKREKYGAVINKIEEYRNAGRPVLVGTTSVEISELLSRMLRQKQIKHNVLNAKQHAKEAQVVAEAGLQSAVTIATNMAGRGTDIKLGESVKDSGGLAIIGTERHDSRRVDLQLRGRAGRQGDPGSSLFYVSLEDDLMRMFGSERIAKVMSYAGYKEGEAIESGMITKSIERAQKKVEENNFGIRKHLLEYDDVMNKQRTVIYAKRNHALFGERLALDIDNAFYFVAESIVVNHKETGDYENFKLNSIVHLALDTKISAEEFQQGNVAQLTEKLYIEASENYQKHKEEIAQKAFPVFQNIRQVQGSHIENVVVPFADGRKALQVVANMQKTLDSKGAELANALEKTLMLGFIDDAWKEHLRAMDDLKQSVRTVQYEQKDPLVIYKQEAFGLFAKMNREVNVEIVTFLTHSHIPVDAQENGQVQEAKQQHKTDMSRMRENKEDIDAVGNGYENSNSGGDYYDPAPAKQQPIVVGPKIGRNDPCPCGSGKKYKNCHGKEV